MNLRIIFVQASFLALASCTKVDEPFVTSFQMKTVDYLSGDSIPNFQFTISGLSDLNGESYKTNAYGNFDTLFTFENQGDFSIHAVNVDHYFIPQNAGTIPGGTNSSFELKLVPFASIQYEFDCSGSGFIQNLNHKRLVPIPPDATFSNSSYGAEAWIYILDCDVSNYYKLFYGDWIITYDYRPNNSMPWEQVSDTISLAPLEHRTYKIHY